MNVAGSFVHESWRLRRREMELSSWCHTPWGRRPRGILSHILPMMTPLAKALPLYRRGVANALDLQARTLDFFFDDLPPAFDGFTILHLSDLHAGTLPGLMERAGDLVQDMPVDIAVVTGDFQTRGRPSAAEVGALAAPLLLRIRSRLGTIAILGNHDRADMADILGAMGVRVLVNEHFALQRGGARIHLTGTDDVHRFYTEDALTAITDGPAGFRILLVHSPDVAHLADQAGVRLYLTGHTHGGQICLPGGLPIATGSHRHRRLARGVWSLGRLQGFTSSGTGVGTPPVRFNSRGEVAYVTLRAKGA